MGASYPLKCIKEHAKNDDPKANCWVHVHYNKEDVQQHTNQFEFKVDGDKDCQNLKGDHGRDAFLKLCTLGGNLNTFSNAMTLSSSSSHRRRLLQTGGMASC